MQQNSNFEILRFQDDVYNEFQRRWSFHFSIWFLIEQYNKIDGRGQKTMLKISSTMSDMYGVVMSHLLAIKSSHMNSSERILLSNTQHCVFDEVTDLDWFTYNRDFLWM